MNHDRSICIYTHHARRGGPNPPDADVVVAIQHGGYCEFGCELGAYPRERIATDLKVCGTSH